MDFFLLEREEKSALESIAYQLRKWADFDRTEGVARQILQQPSADHILSVVLRTIRPEHYDKAQGLSNSFWGSKRRIDEIKENNKRQRQASLPDQAPKLDDGFEVVQTKKNKSTQTGPKKKTSTPTSTTVPKPTQAQKNKDDPLKPRKMCYCQATTHRLLGNCLRCGKIICQEEGDGPCLFCELVLRPKLENKGVDLGDEFVKEPSEMTDAELASFLDAQEHKEKLLEFDRNRTKRTLVFDDQADYYSMDSTKWLTAEQRKKLESYKEEMTKRKIKEASGGRSYEISIDLAGRQVVVHRPDSDSALSNDRKAIEAIMTGSSPSDPSSSSSSSAAVSDPSAKSSDRDHIDSSSFYNPFLVPSARPLFVPTAASPAPAPVSLPKPSSGAPSSLSRVQHNYYQLEELGL